MTDALHERIKSILWHVINGDYSSVGETADKIADLLPALPPGWVATPLEPTEAMLAAGRHEAAFVFDAGSFEIMAKSAYRAMLAARPALSTESGWRDIATAPRDGPILIVASSPLFSERRVYLAWWATPYEAAPDEQCFWRAFSGLGNTASTIPPEWATHWMPLPTPPTETER